MSYSGMLAQYSSAIAAAARDRRTLLPAGALLLGGGGSHWRDRHFAGALSSSLLEQLLEVEGGAAA